MSKYRMVVIMVLTVSLTFCWGQLYAAPVVDKWEIPFLNTWTGVGAGYGALCDYFQKAAVAEINASGGIAGKPIVMKDCDTAMDPTRAASCMKKAIEKSLVILGPMTSLDTQVCAPIAAREQVMCLPVAAGVETIEPARPWAVALMFSNRRDADFIMNTWIDRNPGIKKVVMMGVPTIAQWKARGVFQKEFLEKRGITVLDNIDVASMAVDVSSVVIRTLKSEPDGIVTRLFPADTVRIASELQKRGFTKKERIFIHESADAPELYSMSAESGNVLDGAYVGLTTINYPYPENQKLLEGLRKQKGQEKATKLMWGDAFYVATYIIKDAIEKTGATGDPTKLKEERVRIKDYINSMKNFDSRVWGTISILPDGSFDTPVYIGQIRDSKPVTISSTSEYFKKK